MTPRTPADAVTWAKDHAGDQSWHGQCLSYVRQAYNTPAVYASAWDQWEAPGTRYSATSDDMSKIPYGGPVFFTPVGNPYGHTALYVGGGKIQTTDDGEPHPTVETIAYWESYGHKLVGWRDNLEGVQIPELVAYGDGTDSNDGEDGFVDFTAHNNGTTQKFAPGDWHSVKVEEDGGTYALTTKAGHFIATVALTIEGVEGREYRVRVAAFRDVDDGPDVDTDDFAYQEFISHGGETQVTYTMQGNLDAGHKLRALVWGGTDSFTVSKASSKVTSW